MKLLCALLLFPLCALAQWHALNPVTSVAPLPTNDGVELTAGPAHLRITALGESTVRIRISPHAQLPTGDQDHSWAVIHTPAAPPVHLSQSADAVTLDLPAGHVRITRNPLRIAFLDQQNNVISEDAEPSAFNGAQFRVTKRMPEDEFYFGLGDKTTLNLRDHAYTLWNSDQYGWQESTDPLYKSIPFFYGMRNGRAYGIFLDNTWRSSFNFGKLRHDAFSFAAEGGELNYYFFFGPQPKQVLAAFTDLIGHTPLPPLWALGYQQSRYSYFPESRVREIARTFRAKHIPADVLYLDIDYQDRNRPFTIDRRRFPNFPGMIKDLRQQGFSVIAITDLHIAHADYPPYNSGTAQDVFIKNPDGTQYIGPVWPGHSVFPDFTLTRVRDWWGGLYQDFVDMGIRGFWNDMNEPAVFRYPSKTMPLDIPHRLDDGTTLPHLAIHNVFGMENARATYEGLLKLQAPSRERPFVLTRATYAGGQRYAATWTGDNSATYNHLRMSLPTLLNLSISGQPLVGDDIGGFNGSPTADLATRWMWLGAFNPIFRNHSTKGSNAKEPWAFGPQQEAFQRAAIEQRYRMLPYLYTAAEEAARTGMPILRPLFFEFPHDAWLTANQEEFMFGPAMLVAPRVWEFAAPYNVQLPIGNWYDYWTGAFYQSVLHPNGSDVSPALEGKTLTVNPALNQIPVFIRAGSIIPHQPLVQSTAFTPQGPLELRIYPGANCSGLLYLDDGHTLHPGNNHMHLPMSCTAGAHTATLKLDPQHGAFKPWFKQLKIIFYGIPAPSRSATLTTTASSPQPTAPPQYDPTHHTATVLAPYTPAGETITIRY